MLREFCGAVEARMRKFGFDWSQLIVTLLPVVIEMISNCFNQASDLQAFAEGSRGPLQLAGLRNRCKQVVREQGIRGIFRVATAAAALERAILEELDERSELAAGADDVYQTVFEEAMSVAV